MVEVKRNKRGEAGGRGCWVGLKKKRNDSDGHVFEKRQKKGDRKTVVKVRKEKGTEWWKRISGWIEKEGGWGVTVI